VKFTGTHPLEILWAGDLKSISGVLEKVPDKNS